MRFYALSQPRASTRYGVTVNTRCTEESSDVAVIVTCVCWFTGYVVITNVAWVCPPGTVTEGGTLATCGLLLLSATGSPALHAGYVRYTVAFTLMPPCT